MEDTRKHVQRANVEGQEVVKERVESTRAERNTRQDRIEISSEARRAHASDEVKSERQEKVEILRELHKNGRINSPEKARAAAEAMMKRHNQAD
jgi:anti-sigma28 factor (negative regulator of flagellin synthesis)